MEWWRCPKVDVTFSQEREAEGCTAIANREERLCVDESGCVCGCVSLCVCSWLYLCAFMWLRVRGAGGFTRVLRRLMG